jgi:hypothetical protein
MPRVQNKKKCIEKEKDAYLQKQSIRITSDLLTKTLKSRKAWDNIF